METCVHLQKEVWNFSDYDLIPLRLFVVAEKVGGQVIGAFVGDEMIGFALSIPGTRGGHSYLHSHMLAVKPAYRNARIGQRIKLFQREEALARGFELIEWTFDPLEIKNAHLNITRLGAIARRYVINQYGTSSSPLHGGLPTDRLVAEWWLRSRRVLDLLAQSREPGFAAELTIRVPAEIGEWKGSPDTRARAAEVQSRNREQFLKAFANGLAVLGYDRDSAGNGTFLLGRSNETWSYAQDR
ncbi:MAG: GNAT family N-acetyltransferase [Acidobacteriaceae bacterium]|nr:GNAT family N-acetyltransferase [Acidobacteriaceae bacterium]